MDELLKAYKDFLLKGYARETASAYTKRLALLLKGQNVLDPVGKLDINMVMKKLEKIKYKNHFSQNKNALLHFCKFQNIQLTYETEKRIKELEQTTKKKRRKLKPVEYPTIDKKIKYIRNKRLKLSYQTMIATGLRVSELASISAEDCTIDDTSITFNFIAKGGNNEVVTLIAVENPKLYENLKIHIDDISTDKKIFYSNGYLQSKAKELDFKCHDLRRAFAKLEYKKCKSKSAVKEKLRHSNLKTTNIYLRSKVKI